LLHGVQMEGILKASRSETVVYSSTENTSCIDLVFS